MIGFPVTSTAAVRVFSTVASKFIAVDFKEKCFVFLKAAYSSTLFSAFLVWLDQQA